VGYKLMVSVLLAGGEGPERVLGGEPSVGDARNSTSTTQTGLRRPYTRSG